MLKTNVMRLLEHAVIKHGVHEYDISDGRLDAVSMAEKMGVDKDMVFKTLVTVNPEKQYFVFVIPGPATLDLKKAARASRSKSIVMIPQKELFPLTGYIHGGCSPIGLKKPFPVYIDETAQLFDEIRVSGGHVGVCISIEPETLRNFVNGTFADLISIA